MKRGLIHKKHPIHKALLVIILSFVAAFSYGQTNPTDSLPGDPGAISVYTVQNMNFGAFSNNGNGGTISISANGMRSTTGSIVPLNMGTVFHQAIFDISGPQGTIVSLLFGPDATLTGNHGGTMSMHLTGSSPTSPFITTVTQPLRTPVSISGVLNVGSPAASPPGNYSGTFYIIFNQE